MKRDAPVRVELEPGHPVAFPEPFGDRERIRRTGRGAGHLVTHDARLDHRINDGRPDREPRPRRSLDDRPDRAYLDAIAAPGAGRQKEQFGRSARRAKIRVGSHAAFRAPRDLIDEPPHGVPEEAPPVAGCARDERTFPLGGQTETISCSVGGATTLCSRFIMTLGKVVASPSVSDASGMGDRSHPGCRHSDRATPPSALGPALGTPG